MKSRGALSNAQIESFKGGARYEKGKNAGEIKPQDFLWCSEASGFGIRLGMKTGVKTFILQYRVAGAFTDKVITIGRFGEPLLVDGKVVPLEVNRARAKALELKARMRLGVDPIATMLLTGMRLTESASLKWSDINLDEKTFTLRPDVVKNHNGVTLPMSSVLHDIFAERRNPTENEKAARRRRVDRASEYVFPSFGEKSPHITSAPATFAVVSKLAGVPISRHDLRRTFEDIATECKIDSDQRRLLINHISGDVHSIFYANNRRALASAVEAIATWVTTQAKVAAAGNVVPLHAAAQRAAG